jgi:NAD(P)-dependent dehydrogenase (short-subunit alcohol dehydrogenase family)
LPAVVVTGAAMGIGLAVAEKLASEGINVVALDRDHEALERARAKVGERYLPLDGDIADWDSHERAAAAAETNGGLAGWVNNAGIDWVSAAHEATADHIDRGLKVLLNGPMYGAAVAVRHMLPKRRGSIVNVASIQGVAAFPRYYVYDAAKAGVIMATKSIAVDYGPFGIRCNAVLPGTIETPMTYTTLPPELDRAEALRREGLLAPMLRVGQPAEMAEVVAFLLSDKASFVNGAEIIADGGAMARCFGYPQLNVEAL